MTDTTKRFVKGDYVTLPGTEFSGVYEVFKVTATQMMLQDIVTGKGVSCKPGSSSLKEATPEEIGQALKSAQKVDVTLGTVIRYHNPKAPKGLYVVVKLRPDGRFNAAKLGGDADRYWGPIHPGTVTVVSAAEIEQAFTAAGGEI